MGQNSTAVVVPGTTFKKMPKQSFDRPTQMSLAMAAAGIIPAGHLVRDLSFTALVRNHHDNRNIRPSVQVAF